MSEEDDYLYPDFSILERAWYFIQNFSITVNVEDSLTCNL